VAALEAFYKYFSFFLFFFFFARARARAPAKVHRESNEKKFFRYAPRARA
jgi:hypothetical protein